jgi:hypothetical protein
MTAAMWITILIIVSAIIGYYIGVLWSKSIYQPVVNDLIEMAGSDGIDTILERYRKELTELKVKRDKIKKQ